MDMSFMQDPRYQNAILKLSRLPAYESQAIDTAVADRFFADKDMQRRLLLMQMGARQRRQAQTADLAERRIAQRDRAASRRHKLGERRHDIRRKEQRFQDRNLKIGTAVSVAGAAGDMYAGHRKRMADLKLASAYRKHRI